MAKLIKQINQFLENITVTDRQEENIKSSLSNIEGYLEAKDNDLFVDYIFTNGSYERDTIIRPLNDIDIFAVLKRGDWQDKYEMLPNPQYVLTVLKDYLNSLDDYKDKVIQDRPCVTLQLSDKNFDILPSFEFGDGYWIPKYDLKDWVMSYPKQLTDSLNAVHRQRGYKVKQIIRGVKCWNRINGKIIPSYHIEEISINIFSVSSFGDYEEGIRYWFNNAEYNLQSSRFKNNQDYLDALARIKKVRDKLNEAKKLNDEGKIEDAIKIWKDVFGREFPAIDISDAKSFSKALTDGSLKINASGTLSAVTGNTISASKGFFGDVSEK